MMRKSYVFAAICFVAMLLMASDVSQAAVTDCNLVAKLAGQCVNYLVGKEPAPSKGCCSGVVQLKTAAATQPDRQKACQCIMDAAKKMKNLIEENAKKLPGLCQVSLGFAFGKNTDCSKIPA